MTPVTAQQMRDIERAAIESGTVTGQELMERAGRGVVEAVFEEWPELSKGAHCALVLCGPGNNGGDGFVIARLLRDAGWAVQALMFGELGKLPPDAKANADRWDGPISPLSPQTLETRRDLGRYNLVVDALFGIGLSRPVGLPLSALTCTSEVGQSHRIVAVDLPTGFDTDTGDALGPVAGTILADLTVTFHAPKPAHFRSDCAAHCGTVIVKDIGL